jgi:hypothetical protein
MAKPTAASLVIEIEILGIATSHQPPETMYNRPVITIDADRVTVCLEPFRDECPAHPGIESTNPDVVAFFRQIEEIRVLTNTPA